MNGTTLRVAAAILSLAYRAAAHMHWPTSVLKASTRARSEQKPHIVMILADDLGWNDVGWHGSEIKTPNMDELVQKGLQFTEFHAHSVCTPSRAALLTGRYAFHTGLQHGYIPPGGGFALPRELPLIAEHLRKVGYSTYMVGKWHLGHVSWADTPLERGFDNFFGFLGSSEDYYTHEEGGLLDMWDNCNMVNNSNGVFSADLYTAKAVEVIDTHVKSKGAHTAMFLYLAYQSVHAPLASPPGSEGTYSEIKHKGRRVLAQMVTHLDSCIQKLLQALKDQEMWENTLLLFSSDNGGPTWVGNSNWPLRGSKFTMWQGGHKVPAFIVHGGDKLRSSPRNFTKLAHLVDVAPTFLGAAGVPQTDIAGKCYDGLNLWPFLTGEEDDMSLWDRSIVLNIDSTNVHVVQDPNEWSGYAGIRDLEWKLVLGNPGEPNGRCFGLGADGATLSEGNCDLNMTGIPDDRDQPHLYHLRTDPTESIDVAARNPHIVKIMKEKLKPFMDSEWEPLNADGAKYGSTTPEAQLMAKIAGGWAPWEECSSQRSCKCEVKSFFSVFNTRMAQVRPAYYSASGQPLTSDAW